MRYFTNSELQTARRCMRKWYLTFYRKLYSRAESVNENRLIGDLCHDALADMYNHGQDPVATVVYVAENLISDQQDMLTEDRGENARIQIEQNIETIKSAWEFAQIIIEGYVEWLQETGEDSHLQLISAESEQWVRLPVEQLGKPVALLGKLDAKFNDLRSNARVFMDHKTVANFADRERWIHLDTQFRFYGLIEYLKLLEEGMDKDVAQGSWTDGGILNMLRRVKRTSRSTPPFYKRREVRHSLIELQNFFHRTVGEISRIVQAENLLDQGFDHQMVCAPNPSKDCTWDCQFMTLCAFMDDGSDVDGYIQASFEVGNPIRRYTTVEGLEA